MAQMAPDFLSSDLTHPHHTRALWILAAALALFGVLIWIYGGYPEAVPAPAPVDELSARRALLEQPNPPANLSPAEIKARQVLLNSPNPPANLSPQELEARRALLENI